MESAKVALKRAIDQFEIKLADCSTLVECRTEVDKLKTQLDCALEPEKKVPDEVIHMRTRMEETVQNLLVDR